MLSSLPYKSSFTRENFLASHFDNLASTSVSSSDSYETTTKILSGCSFQSELKKQYNTRKMQLNENTKPLYIEKPNVDGLISSSLYKYLDSDLHLGEYKICKVNRRFTPNRDFTSRIVNEGYAKVSGKSIIFTEEFANRINSCPNALFRLKEINDLELQVRDRAIENRKPF